ncbi:hypothetical protein ACFLS1_02200 [Verrucomicrobiota bacterium]
MFGLYILPLLFALTIPQLHAGKVVLRLRVGNPEKGVRQFVDVKSTLLPAGVKPKDILDLPDDLKVGYDVNNNVYYVHGKVELDPGSWKEFKVSIKDIWIIPQKELDELAKWTDDLVGKLEGFKHYEVAGELKKHITGYFDQIKKRQDENAIKPGVNAVQHIRAYEINFEILQVVKKDIGRLENLVLETGQPLGGQLVGDHPDAPKVRERVKLDPEEYKTIIYKVTVYNPSPDKWRKMGGTNSITPSLKHYLPSEIRPDDILDPGGLEVRKDSVSEICYLYKKELEVAPASNVVFEVKIRDKWNVNMPQVKVLRSEASGVLKIVVAKETYPFMETTLNDIIVELDEIEKEAGPVALDEQYVAFYRNQADRLDIIQQKINRIKVALRPSVKGSKLGFDAPAPSMKTTWLIIYIILGFLAIMSLLFFLRWFVKTKAEKIADITSSGE